ncbi:MAG: CoA pyrophosphatase [Gammaproteobacteria bacterium]|nr:CoA pyrophosphatase [Gammaproteobacteria bacterium]
MECDAALKSKIAHQLAQFTSTAASHAGNKSAAVALTITDAAFGPDLSGLPEIATWSSNAALILTRRSTKLRNHAGQWALPGGRIDSGETPVDTALRELAEEIGLQLHPDQVLGRLDDFVTRSGFIMTPIVVWAGPQATLTANQHEVDSIHRIPLREFLRDDAPLLEAGEDPARPVMRMPVGDSWIAAPTAALLYQFREVCLLGKATRVAHFDQPAFAWR